MQQGSKGFCTEKKYFHIRDHAPGEGRGAHFLHRAGRDL